MNRLFFKIFIGFWLITITVLLSMLAATRYSDEFEKSDQPSAYELGKAAQGILSRTADIARDRSPKELDLWLVGLPSIHSVNAYIINLQEPKRSTPVPDDIRLLAEKITLEQPTLVTKTENVSLYGRMLIRDQQAISKLLIATPLPPSPFVYFFTKYIWFRLLVGILVSGIICFFMARSITRPIIALRKATQQLANGNLNFRFEVNKLANDEISELGHDFNNMAQRLEKTLEEQKQLVRDISHELRSPLGRIQAALALAQRKHGEDTAELERVEKECERLNALISQLLVMPNYSQELTDCIDLVGLLHGIASDDQLEAELSHKVIEIISDCDELLYTTSGGLLWHAVDNLTRNALRHTPANTKVSLILTYNKPQGEITITVRDQGNGVPEESLEKIFLPFYREETARSHQNNGGHGLGLSIASRAIQHHGGNIKAQNIQGGFEFVITLPDSLIVEA
ncbi:ATP-binding protein [Oceanicoccus sp. KOV_DT_Chl]|uniref:ATP-binding protein n=1 Tax=Oceanicoccus sp. KOV_DT_Chl TaxID=1904639 RepID=UPI000C7E1980|nr:ATP-binding protein [Oceanicoccus sp. KOV_DT_Chl]